MTTIVKASEARSRLFTLMDKAERLRNRFILTREGKPQAVLMSAEEYEEWVETLEILQDKELTAGIEKGLADIKKGRTRPLEEELKSLCEGPEHIGFNWTIKPAKYLRDYLRTKVREFAKDLKILGSEQAKVNKIQKFNLLKLI